MDKQTVDAMERFYLAMNEIYDLAESLLDCTEEVDEKQVFKTTRGALYGIQDQARDLFHKWRMQLEQEGTPA